MDKILVTGANGQLGSEIKAIADSFPKDKFFFTDLGELNICQHKAVELFVNRHKINIIINCAAYTAVDKAEGEFDLANKINHLAVKNFARIAKMRNIKMVHISTDYVFDGQNHQPYLENDKPNPQSVYGKTKLDGEIAVQAVNPANTIIIRTSWVYSNFGANFVKTMLKLSETKNEISVITDQIGSPTNASDLAKSILTILPYVSNKNVEIYNYSNEGICSWYDFAIAIFDISKINIKVEPILSAQFHTAAKRPLFSVLNKTKIKDRYPIKIPYWRSSLIKNLRQRNVKFK
ncbi:dTDP-4-dehydrorhamnose reductase [Akkermansiaceae bacterium]|nr:dTDP-4-dehydrorhamnose reductase [Akkermansiaceae bacterium]